jgi:hypothetical protein
MVYLAIGIHLEDGYTWSIGVDSDDPQTVADLLKSSSKYCYPDQILLVTNGNPIAPDVFDGLLDSPSVCRHWNINKDYQE